MESSNEIWKDIEGFQGLYRVSNLGRIKASATRKLRGRYYHNLPEKILKLNHKSNGYINVMIQKSKMEKTISVHRLVALHFVYNPDLINNTQLNHKNGIKSDNRADNLEWCTPLHNIRHSLETGLKKKQRGEQLPIAKLNNAAVLDIRQSKLSDKELAIKYNVYWSTINKVKQRQTWRHI